MRKTSAPAMASALRECVAWWAVLVAVYLGSLTTVTTAEVAAALVLGLAGAVLAAAGRRAAGARWRMPAGVLKAAVTLPIATLADAGRMLAAMMRPGRLRAESGQVREVVTPTEPVPARDGRVAMGGLLLSATPGSVLIGADLIGAETDPRSAECVYARLTVHELAPGRRQLADKVAGS